MNDLKSLEQNALDLVRLAQNAGADACDVVVASGSSLSVSVREGKTENTNRSESDTLYLRVFCGKKVATVTANQTGNFDTLAERAVAMAKVSPEDPYQGLAGQELLFAQAQVADSLDKLDLFDSHEPTPAIMENLALEAEAAGLAVEGVSKSMGSGFGWSTAGFVLATSHGFSGSSQRSGFSLSTAMLAGDGTGMERDYDFHSAIHFDDLESAEKNWNRSRRACRKAA